MKRGSPESGRAFRDRLAAAAADFAVMAAALLASYALRFNFGTPPGGWLHTLRPFAVIVATQFAALWAFGCYRVVWRFVSVWDIPRFVYASAASSALMVILRLLLPEWRMVRPPISVALMNGALFLGGALLARLVWRGLREGPLAADAATAPSAGSGIAKRVLLVGAGVIGNTVARELRQHRSHGVDPVAFLDDDPAKQGTLIQGVPVCGTLAELREVVGRLRVQEVLVTMARASRRVVRDVVHACEACGVAVRIAPGYFEILDGSLSVNRLREVDISDLLGREEVDLGGEDELAGFISGRRVLISGAGGSIGSELARQVARFGPRTLVLVDRCEPALYEIDRALRESGRASQLRAVVADIGDEVRMRAVLARHSPQIVLHAAAHKHVPMMEANVCEAIRNNVLATRRFGELAVEAAVEVFVQLSTDKAVNPTSIMGVSKRLAEIALQDLNGLRRTRFAAVRFGNVLGASGSVVPLFREQIRRGGPVTVTHPDMRRYFMTIPEAARLVLVAATMARDGEIFILDMGTPVRIVELAEEMIRLSGLQPHQDIPIVFTGLRPGEKLFEELSTRDEHADRTRHPRIFIGRIPPTTGETVAAGLSRLAAVGAADDERGARQLLSELVPESRLEMTSRDPGGENHA